MRRAGVALIAANHETDVNAQELRELLERVEDTRELVLLDVRGGRPDPAGELHAAWRDAADAADRAYGAWCVRPIRATFAAYRAAADRADAAQDALWLQAARRALAYV
jgi:hypothetical protein